MKTAMIARFVLGAGAIFAVAGLAGCGAGEQGSGDPGAIGSTSEALTKSSLTAMSVAREFASSCKVTGFIINSDNSHTAREFVIVAAGKISNTPTYATTAELYDPVANTWSTGVTFTGSGSARELAQMVQNPADSTSCLLIGGENNGTPQDQIVKFTFSNPGNFPGTPTLTVGQAGRLNTARSKLGVVKCGSSPTKLLIVGGQDGSNPRVALSSLELWNGQGTNTLIGTISDTLTDARYDLAIAEKDSTHIVVAGGQNALGRLNSIETLEPTSSACTSVTTDILAATLTHNRTQLAGFYEGSDKFDFVGGEDGTPAAVADLDTLTVNWATHSSSSLAAGTGILSGAAARPVLVPTATAGRFVLFGGTASGSPLNHADEYQAGTGWTASPPTMSVARLGAVGEFANGEAVAFTGFVSGTTYTTTVDKLTH